MQVRKDLGLCFNWDENFTPSDRCATRRLLILQWDIYPPDDLDSATLNYVVELDTP